MVAVLSVALAAFCAQAILPSEAAAASDRLPNLRMIPLRDWDIKTVNGRRLLRFTTIMVNKGPGHFEVRGRRPSTSVKKMTFRQVLYDDDGGRRSIPTEATGTYAGDGHDHWHVNGIMTYELFEAGDLGTIAAGAKTGFCFFDTTPWRLGLPYARQLSYYQEEWCGTRETLRNRVGISVGWGDRYPWYFAYQWIDITGLPGGRYVVRATVDIQDWYEEENDFDNCRWTRIRIPAPGSGKRVRVLSQGGGCGRDAITQVDTFPGARTYDPPRLLSLLAGKYSAYAFNSAGTEVGRKTGRIDTDKTFRTIRRASVPGRAGKWFYMTSGRWAGYWLRDTASVALVD